MSTNAHLRCEISKLAPQSLGIQTGAYGIAMPYWLCTRLLSGPFTHGVKGISVPISRGSPPLKR